MALQQYVVRMSDRSLLTREERDALQAAMREIVAREAGKQTQAADVLGVSQPAVGKAVNRADIGPAVARKVLHYFGVDLPTLVARFGSSQTASALRSKLVLGSLVGGELAVVACPCPRMSTPKQRQLLDVSSTTSPRRGYAG